VGVVLKRAGRETHHSPPTRAERSRAEPSRSFRDEVSISYAQGQLSLLVMYEYVRWRVPVLEMKANLNGIDHLTNSGVDGKILLKRALNDKSKKDSSG
jgi:hypothetical protein